MKPTKRDVTESDDPEKNCDVSEDENVKPKNKKHDVKPTKRDVMEDKKGTPKNRKRDVKPKSGVKEDENGKSDNKKRDVKNTSDGNGEKRRDVNNDSDEDLAIKRSKTSVVSLRRSARQQQNKNEIQNKLSKLKNQQSKKLAAPFILDKSDVTFQAPHGFYGNFGMKETLNEDQSKTCNASLSGGGGGGSWRNQFES